MINPTIIHTTKIARTLKYRVFKQKINICLDRQSNGRRNTTQKTKDWATQSPLKTPDMKEFPAPLVAPIVLLLNDRTTIL